MVPAEAAPAGRCKCAVTEGTSLQPPAVSKNVFFRKHDGNKVALDLELDRKEKLSKFLNYLTFQILWGFPLGYFKQDISLLFLKQPHSVAE